MKKRKSTEENDNNIETDNSTLYHQFRSALATNDFKAGEKYLTADLTTDSKKLKAIAEIKPSVELSEDQLIDWQNNMIRNVMSMDDLTADVLDILTSVWLEKSASPTDMVTLSVDNFLSLRGIQPKKNGDGRRGGFEEEQRKIISNQMNILDNTWIKVHEMEVTEVDERQKKRRVKWRGESKAVYISYRFGKVNNDNNMEAYVWNARPGDVFANFLFGHGRQTALLSQKALEYDPYRQKVEKRLARYFAWQWRNRQSSVSYFKPFTIKTLLEAIKENVYYRMPSRTKERIEKALDTLQNDNVIRGWQYENFDDSKLKKGWVDDWLTSKVLIEPPEAIILQYEKIKKFPVKSFSQPIEINELSDLKRLRKEKKLTILQLSEEIGISASTISRVERGDIPSEDNKLKIIEWIKSITT
ncbi:helix-turn-helix domain-containing protein [Pseudobacteroides cellulosolvens]|uniref:Helix-turn-helix domain protein n=1 Tax=Pseudobacteroides cellulosolvens ATCC 35603 = DSM 2933 TaxID=398512 RepID=A0A0L6JQD2_9FIRM|nr:helix-turn-helix transcriptional regulator [Pseudobacteroides cellulosolvens]KNY27572.1 helix-turn-helix domain protein [Pseudobacteroides cellulosolvens ATCC 35603 = DSM 2933]